MPGEVSKTVPLPVPSNSLRSRRFEARGAGKWPLERTELCAPKGRVSG